MSTSPPAQSRRELVNRLLSGSAGVVALSALGVSVYQAYITREQQRMSAWPYVAQGNTGGDSSYAYLVSNVGLGPALVRSMTVHVRGRPVRTWDDVRRATLGADTSRFDSVMRDTRGSTSSVRRGMVLLPGNTTELLRVTGPGALSTRRLVTDTAVRIRVCYCSLYRECWLSDSRAVEPAPVRACAYRAPDEFES